MHGGRALGRRRAASVHTPLRAIPRHSPEARRESAGASAADPHYYNRQGLLLDGDACCLCELGQVHGQRLAFEGSLVSLSHEGEQLEQGGVPDGPGGPQRGSHPRLVPRGRSSHRSKRLISWAASGSKDSGASRACSSRSAGSPCATRTRSTPAPARLPARQAAGAAATGHAPAAGPWTVLRLLPEPSACPRAGPRSP